MGQPLFPELRWRSAAEHPLKRDLIYEGYEAIWLQDKRDGIRNTQRDGHPASGLNVTLLAPACWYV
jgi:hypothetical protein